MSAEQMLKTMGKHKNVNFKQIIRVNPVTGRTERPWRNRDHEFVLGDPAKGNVKHHDEHATKVDNYGEALECVERGFSIRMSDGETPPSLVSPGSLTFLDDPVERLDDLWSYSMPALPFSREQLERDIRGELMSEAGEIYWIANSEAANAFIGFPLDIDAVESATEIDRVELARFNLARVVICAYESAFRAGPLAMSEEDADELELLIGATFNSFNRRYGSPLQVPTSPLRRTMLSAYFRWKLSDGDLFGSEFNQSAVETLAVLAGMTDQGVRNSLNKEGLSPVRGKVDYPGIIRWLENRRDFFPLREDERPAARSTWAAIHELTTKPPKEALAAIAGRNPTADRTALKAAELQIAEALTSGRQPHPRALRAYARSLGFNIDTFVRQFPS